MGLIPVIRLADLIRELLPGQPERHAPSRDILRPLGVSGPSGRPPFARVFARASAGEEVRDAECTLTRSSRR